MLFDAYYYDEILLLYIIIIINFYGIFTSAFQPVKDKSGALPVLVVIHPSKIYFFRKM